MFHDPAAALVIDGVTVAAAEEERFTRRKHGKSPVAFSTWELPEQAMAWCLAEGGVAPAELDAVAYSYDPELAFQPDGDITAAEWEGLRTLYARRAPLFLKTRAARPRSRPRALGRPPRRPRGVRHLRLGLRSRAACSCSTGAGSAAPTSPGATWTARWRCSPPSALPHSLGLLYEELTAHLGFRRSSDEYKVMAMASYAAPEFLDAFRSLVRADGRGGFVVGDVDLGRVRAAARPGRGLHAGARGAGLDRADAAGGGPARARRLAARPDGRPRSRHGRRRGAQLRRQLAPVAREPVRADLGAAGLRRLGHGARRRAPRRARARRRRGADALGRAGPRLGRRCAGRAAGDRRGRLRAARRHRRRRRRGAGRQPGRRLVPGAVGVRPARARPPLAAGRPARGGEPREDERHQGPRAVPADRADGAGRARRGRSSRVARSPARSCSSRTA